MSENVKILKSVKLDFGLVELRSDNILTFIPNENISSFNVSHLETMLATFKKLTNGTPIPYYTDNTHLTENFGSEEKSFISEHFHLFATAFAMKEASPVTRFITHTFIHLYKPKIPIKMFKTKEGAINWLKSLS